MPTTDPGADIDVDLRHDSPKMIIDGHPMVTDHIGHDVRLEAEAGMPYIRLTFSVLVNSGTIIAQDGKALTVEDGKLTIYPEGWSPSQDDESSG